MAGRDDKGRFASGNPGRPRGAKDKTSKRAKTVALAFVQEYFHSGQAAKDWDKMEPYQRWTIITRLLGIVLPKETAQKIDLRGLDPQQAARIALETADLLEEE